MEEAGGEERLADGGQAPGIEKTPARLPLSRSRHPEGREQPPAAATSMAQKAGMWPVSEKYSYPLVYREGDSHWDAYSTHISANHGGPQLRR